MRESEKRVFVEKLAITFGKIFETGVNFANKASVAMASMVVTMGTYTNTMRNSTMTTLTDAINGLNSDASTKTNLVDDKLTAVESKSNENITNIVNISKLGTMVGTVDKYSDLTTIVKDQVDGTLSNGDFAEVETTEGNKPAGLYRYSNGSFHTAPFVNYDEANQIDEPISQATIDNIVGV